MTFKIPFIQASRRVTGVNSYTILETKKLNKLVGSILLQWDQEGKKLPKNVKILNALKIQKAACCYDGLYSKQKLSFAQFSPASNDKR